MKAKRFGALCLALCLAFSLAVVPALAVDFPDVPEDFWGGKGYEDIHEMYVKGYAQGYEDGTFRPNSPMSYAETLLFCARITGVDKATQARISADHAEEIADILPSDAANGKMNTWAADELALAVEVGVITRDELTALCQADPANDKGYTYIREGVTREAVAKHLIRAMQLEPMARSLSANTVGSILDAYPDKEDISEAYRPYVALLTNYGIVQGKGTGETTPIFHPQGSVTRAEMITMIRRALDFMAGKGTVVELSEYTDYSWLAGIVTATATAANGDTIVTLENALTGASQSYSLGSSVSIYENNMLAKTSALKRGKYVRLNLDAKGNITDIRLTGALTEYAGTVEQLENGLVTLKGPDGDRSFTVDRFTSVAVGQTLGNRDIIDYEAGYTAGTCYVDEHGHLAAVRFAGGTQLVEGLVESVTTTGGTTTLSVAAYNGVVTKYTIPEGSIITVNKAPGGALSINHVGRAVQLRVNTDSDKVESVNVDTISSYVQGPITKLGRVGAASTITIRDRFTGKDVVYPVSTDAVVTYNGDTRTVAQIETNWYATASTSINEAGNTLFILVDAYPGSTQVEGALTAIEYGTAVTTIEVTLPDGGVLTYDLTMSALPAITRGGKTSTVDQLRNGDKLVLTIRYNRLEKIEATAQTANVTGEIQKVTLTTEGVEIDVLLSGESETTKYALTDGVSVTQGTASSNIYNLKPGYTVAMVTDKDNGVLSINITSVAAATSRNITGTVYTISTANRVMTLLVASPSGGTTTVQVDMKDATLMNISGKELSVYLDFAAGDTVEAWGSYDGATFVATLVLKK